MFFVLKTLFATVVISLVIIIVGRLFSKKKDGTINYAPDSNPHINDLYCKMTKEAILNVEYPRRKQILEESVDLIYNSYVLDTIMGRYDIAMEQFLWIAERMEEGYSIYFRTEECGFVCALNRITNIRISSSADKYYSLFIDEISTLKMKRAKENRRSKVLNILSTCGESLKDHENKEDIMIHILSLEEKVKMIIF